MRLRPYKSCDAQHIIHWCKDEDIYWKWSGGRFGEYPVTAETIDDKYRNQNGDCVEEDNFYPMTACGEEGILGSLIIRYIHGDSRILRLGWVILDGEKRGKGYGKEMISLALKYCFELLQADQVTIGVFENNLPAYHCYKAAGFKDAVIEQEEYAEINGQKWKILELEINKEDYFQ